MKSILALFLGIQHISSFTIQPQVNFQRCRPLITSLSLGPKSNDSNDNYLSSKAASQKRREILQKTVSAAIATLPVLSSTTKPAWAVERAVGSAEQNCRETGNCLEKGDWDGAVGWNWGGRDRCDATDPRCGADGQLQNEVPQGESKPDDLGLKMTHKVTMDLTIGKSEKGSLVFGLYGNNAPYSVQQIVEFLEPNQGILSTSKLYLEDGYGVSSAPVSLLYSGTMTTLYPNMKLDFGITSQQIAYGKKKGISRIPDTFVAQPRPTKTLNEIKNESSVRPHNAAGLISIPSQGLGYGGSGFEPEDEAFASSFQIISTAIPDMDKKEKRKVIGQIMDKESMAFLARLSSLPAKKGLKGIVPGQNYGPPLLKVQVVGIKVEPLSFEVSNTSD